MTARGRQRPDPSVQQEPGPGPRPKRLFAALAVPNFRLYLAGQAISLPGITGPILCPEAPRRI